MNRILDFLADLAVNNNRDWFQLNRSRYDEAHRRFLDFAAEYLALMAEIDPALAVLTPKDCIWRIYRDTRFSANKTPYKEWFGVFAAAHAPGKPVAATGGKKSQRGGYYIHLQPGNCLFAGGIWNPSSELLKALRQEIDANADEVESIMSAPAWRRWFGDFDTDNMLKKVPAGFDPQSPHADWLKRKAFTFSTPLSDGQVCSEGFLDIVSDIVRAAKPMNDFLNYTFEEYGEFPERRC
jgi:uncharacterized protein (TIGR02453 family)